MQWLGWLSAGVVGGYALGRWHVHWMRKRDAQALERALRHH